MRTLSLEFLLMTTSTLLASWFVVINRAFADCSASSLETTSHWRTISLRKRLFEPTKTSAAFGARLGSRHGYTESPIIASEKMPGAERNWLESMNRNGKKKSIL